MTSQYPTDPTEIAAALRRVADDLDTLAGCDLPPMSVSVNVQVSSYCDGDEAEQQRSIPTRRAAVDTLIGALTPGGHGVDHPDSQHYSLDFAARGRDCLSVVIFTGAAIFDEDALGGAA